MTWQRREFRCKHGFVNGHNCPDCKGKAPPQRRKSVQRHHRHYVPVGYGKEEVGARRGCS